MTTQFAIAAALAALAALLVLVVRHRAWRTRAAAQIHALQLRFEQELAQASQERNRLLDALGDAFLLVDADAHIRFANAAAHDLCGGRNLLQRPVSEIFLDPHLAHHNLGARQIKTQKSIDILVDHHPSRQQHDGPWQ